MKRPGSSDSFGALISISQPEEDTNSRSKQVYSKEFQAMLDSLVEEDSLLEESFNNATEKKRRLTVDQVKALEKNFEVENKLEPERKAKIAQELGLQPRQVAIWFQNRRARWKTKQLEKDYGVLKANYDALKLDYSNLQQEREVLAAKLKELRGKVKEENVQRFNYGKQGCPVMSEQNKDQANSQKMITSPSSSSCVCFNGSSSSSWHSWVEPFRLANSVSEPQIVKIEEQSGILTPEESCNFFSVDHAPTLQWCFSGK